MKRYLIQFVTLACTSLAGGQALAHTGHHEPGSFLAGVAHPLMGGDHVLALFAIGLWTASASTRRRGWLPALIFLCTMAVAVTLAVRGMTLPAIEASLAVSLLVAGLLLSTLVRFRPVNTTALIALFALVHGQSHGLAMPAAAEPLLYGFGLLLSSGLMLLVALGLGEWLRHSRAEWVLRSAGLLSGGVGAWLLLGT